MLEKQILGGLLESTKKIVGNQAFLEIIEFGKKMAHTDLYSKFVWKFGWFIASEKCVVIHNFSFWISITLPIRSAFSS